MTKPGAITITRSGGLAAHWTQVIDRCERGEAQTLKSDGGASVLALPGESGSAGLIVKRWELRTFGARLKSALHASRAWRHWKGADRLKKAGVRTAACYAIARSVSRDGDAVEWLIMDRLPGKTLLQHMADHDLTVTQEHRIADNLGTLLGTLFRKRLFNRDGKPSNWIVTDPAAGTLAVIDTVAVQRTFEGNHGARSLAMLVLEPLGCGVLPRRALRWRTVRAFDRSLGMTHAGKPVVAPGMWWEAAAKLVHEHGDPTPRVNPLAPLGPSRPA